MEESVIRFRSWWWCAGLRGEGVVLDTGSCFIHPWKLRDLVLLFPHLFAHPSSFTQTTPPSPTPCPTSWASLTFWPQLYHICNQCWRWTHSVKFSEETTTPSCRFRVSPGTDGGRKTHTHTHAKTLVSVRMTLAIRNIPSCNLALTAPE